MNFKKDYINYVLYTVIQNEFYGARDDVRIRKILEKVISIPDTAKAAFLAGKTSGLEILFKYLLYISDKIDKSQITIFNLKDNFEYDIQNLKKICEEIKSHRSEIQTPATEKEAETDEKQTAEISTSDESGETEEPADVLSAGDDAEQEKEEQAFTLIENAETGSSDNEVFGLEGITRSVEREDETENIAVSDELKKAEPETEELDSEIDEESIKEAQRFEQPVEETTEIEEDEILTASETAVLKSEEIKEPELKDELEIEIKSSENREMEQMEEMKEGSVTSEAYYRFETKFFEEVKILEKLFSNTKKECKGKPLKKLSEKTLQRFSEIIEISSELADLTRQLSLDLTADIFLTINLLFTKAINTTALINPERIELLTTSLSLVTSLIKGEDYLGYDELVRKIESLRAELQKPVDFVKKEIEKEIQYVEKPEAVEENLPLEADKESVSEISEKPALEEAVDFEPQEEEISEIPAEEIVPVESPEEIIEPPVSIPPETAGQDTDTVHFKMKYLVKEFEKNFINITKPDGKFTKYEVLDEIDNLNNLLRMLAKISSSVRNSDVLKLSEVSYVFLKYLKDYRMDLLDAEIKQIVKYIIFTYKMLLTDRKPEDFEILVQYLNNPVKIFTDT